MSTLLLPAIHPQWERSYSTWIDHSVNCPHTEIRQSSLGQNEVIDELLTVWKDCQSAGWDGHGAKPVQPETVSMACEMLRLLPLGFPGPSIGAEPDGQITMEWRKSPYRVLSVSIDPEGYLHYAGLFGGNQRYGKLEYFGNVPQELIQLVSDL